MQIDLTALLVALITAICGALTGIVIPYIKSKTTLTQRETAQVLVTAAVTAAEQLFKGSGLGANKKAYVMDWLAKRGLSVKMDELDAFIEAAVLRLKNELTEG